MSSTDSEKKRRIFAVVDCDNFFVSCERVFDSRLQGKPVVVLSNNDGVIISRSAEAKALGIKMATPFYQAAEIIHTGNVAVRSGNYILYGDMSRRVMETLRWFSPNIELYSIDEVFLELDGFAHLDLEAYAREIRATVLKWTGLPVSVGVGETKTLAKLATEHAKKKPETRGVVNLTGYSEPAREALLAATSVDDIWGIGRQLSKWLISIGVTTALALRTLSDQLVRKKMGVTGLRLVQELRGISCLSLNTIVPPRKMITCSRSFGNRVRAIEELREAVSSYAAQAGRRLRQDGSAAGALTVFLLTNKFADEPQFSKSATLPLVPITECDHDLINTALAALDKIYRPGFPFYKIGVTLSDLTPAEAMQTDMFIPRNEPRRRRLNHVVDDLNLMFGDGTIRYAITGFRRRWKPRSNLRSPRYTTQWDDVPQAG